ncbi:hypothetical protein [Verrucosispora sp. WMMD573]|uniref:hypothetical protein n=1 Tax=Verrucosispora sp. WMMD573 TaxID=3015149 RepID=UPI00248B62AD|nr:hypothetical protein [Verrucosispora sp. WMMD573]WBB52260.1 hypothetical protein O7601_16785 [Verrucosispora sp. WMMD573]
MSSQQPAGLPQHIGLSIELVEGSRTELVLKVGTSRLQCVLVPDDPEFFTGSRYHGPAHTLDRWICELERLPAEDRVMLPFNFSDQCTGWLRVTAIGEGLVEVQAGWSNLGEYEFDPKEFPLVARDLPDFAPVRNALVKRPLADIVAAVTASRDNFIN